MLMILNFTYLPYHHQAMIAIMIILIQISPIMIAMATAPSPTQAPMSLLNRLDKVDVVVTVEDVLRCSNCCRLI